LGAQKGRISPSFFRADSRVVAHVAASIGGDRNAAIRCRSSAKMSCEIATSAIWNVT
jgi:hypothetical protein